MNGYGEAARNYYDQLRGLNGLEITPIHIGEATPGFTFPGVSRHPPAESDYLILVWPPSHRAMPPVEAVHVIWVFYWETDRLRQDMADFLCTRPSDTIVSPSLYMRNILRDSGVFNPLMIIPHTHKKNRRVGRDRGVCRFYAIAQDVPRKNLRRLIECFSSEFRENDLATLTVKVGSLSSSGLSSEDDRVHILSGDHDNEFIRELHRDHDVFVDFSNSEGWGFPHVDAMLTGNAIVTPAGGSLEWLVQGPSSFVIPSVLGDVGAGQLYPASSKWAVFTDRDARDAMRSAYNAFREGVVFEHPHLRHLLCNQRLVRGLWATLLQMEAP